jgi:hypothetical protein
MASEEPVMSFRNRLSAERSVLRLSVDPISNTVAITKSNPLYAPSQLGGSSHCEADWGMALASGNLADDLLPLILHELTHHSSLQGPVGASLGALALSHTSVRGLAATDENSLIGPARDRVLYTAVDLYLRPLLEGIALFQEFDAVAGAVPLSTWASQVGAILFCREELSAAVPAGKDILFPLKAKIEQLRLSSEFISRKKDLLRKGLEDSGGYLLGYLLVKMIWGDLIARNKIWRNTDLFLMFINDYFFSDFSLALLLVRPPQQTIDSELDDLKEYMSYRLLNLSHNAQTFGKEFLQHYLGQTAQRPSYQGFKESLKSALDTAWLTRTLRNIHYETPDFISGRTYPRVLAAPAAVTVNEHGQFEAKFSDGSPSFHGPALKAAMPISGNATTADGSVEAIVLLPQNGRRDVRVVICTFLDKELVATFDPRTREFNDPDAASACDRLGSYLAYESFAVQVAAELPVLHEGTGLAKLLASYSGAEGTQRMIDLWGQFALVPDVDKDEIAGVCDLLRKDGLNGALHLTSSSLGRLARLSLQPLEAEPPAPALTADDEKWIAEINAQSRERLGFALVVVKDRKLDSSRV